MIIQKQTARLISALAIALLVVVPAAPAWAISPPTPPSASEAPTAAETPTASEAPTAPEAPPQPDAPTAPTAEETLAPDTAEPEESTQSQETPPTGQDSDGDGGYTGASTDSPSESTSTQSTGNQTGGQTDDGNLGDTTIDTGNATNGASILTSANTNLGSATCNTCSGGANGATVKNIDNGSGSTNTGSASITDNSTTTQNNTAKVDNALTQNSNTGNNSASRNTGGNSTITTGDANTTGTLVTAVNTNIDGVAVAEFNVVDDQVGDLVLDFTRDCISGCGGTSPATVVNSGNGSDSTNTGSIDQTTNDTTFQTNDATLESTMTLNSDSGHNQTDRNTGGNSTITTGDANVAANALTFANNNLSGNVYYYVINVFGDLVGDIIFPEELLAYGGATVANLGNGDNSTNNANLTLTNTDTTTQTNIANIQNNLVFDATTGNNATSRNTTGTSSITTGDANIEAQVLNVANSNVAGGSWWLVIVNEAGRWIGRLFGAPDGANYAGSPGTEFTLNEAGEITAVNAGNGSGSTNNATINQTNNSTTVQSNTANIVNNLNLSANTGGNSATRNTGGNSTITTGDASVVANLVNFVNNNITGGGKLFVTVVNVFGSWLGDFMTPGSEKQDDPENPGIGGTAQLPQEGSQQQNGAGGNSSSSQTAGTSTSTNGSFGNGSASTLTNTTTILARNTGRLLRFAAQDQAEAELENTAPQEISEGNRVVNLNLAWLLLLIPLAVLIPLGRRLAALKLLPRH